MTTMKAWEESIKKCIKRVRKRDRRMELHCFPAHKLTEITIVLLKLDLLNWTGRYKWKKTQRSSIRRQNQQDEEDVSSDQTKINHRWKPLYN